MRGIGMAQEVRAAFAQAGETGHAVVTNPSSTFRWSIPSTDVVIQPPLSAYPCGDPWELLDIRSRRKPS